MGLIFRVILSLSISGGLVGLLTLLFRPVARRFFAKRWIYYLWLLVLVRLLVPVHADINLMGQLSAILTAAGNPQAGVEEEAELSQAENTEAGKQQSNVLGMESAEYADQTSDAAADENVWHNETAAGTFASGQVGDRGAGIFQIAGMIWFLGMLLTGIYRVSTYRNFVKGINAGCMPVTDRMLLNKSAEIHTRLGIMKEVPVYENAAVNTPMLIGLRRPHIVLPSKLLAKMAGRENDICLILHHELIHYKRRDIWYKWLFQAALCVHWFNPFLYLFNRKFNVDCELSCDEAVMTLLSEEGRRTYGNVLLDVAEKNLPEETFTVHRNVPTMTLLEEKRTLKERLQGIAGYEKKGFIIGFCSALALSAFVAAAVVCGVAGVKADSREMFVMRNGSQGFVERVTESISKSTMDLSFLEEPKAINKKGKPYLMYDDDALIAGEIAQDNWQAWNYYGGKNRVNIGKFVLNGSDMLWIVYANKETTLELTSAFTLHSGRFKVVQVMPDQTVQILNEDGEETAREITLSEGRNCFKMVGQKARVEDIEIEYSSADKKGIDAVFYSEDEEYAYRVQAGLEPLDMAKLNKVSVYLDAKEVSGLYRYAWENGMVLSDENWTNLAVYSDSELTGRYLREALQAGKIEEFDSRILVKIASYIKAEDVSECFRYLLERGKVSESDYNDIFVYSDADLSAKYLMEALSKEGRMNEFGGKFLGQVNAWVSPEALADIVLALGKDELTFQDLREYVFAYLGYEQTVRCIFHYIDLGNILTDSQLREVQPYVSEKDFYRIIEYNGKNK